MQTSIFSVHRPNWEPETNTASFTFTLGDWSFLETVVLPPVSPLNENAATDSQSETFYALLNLAAAILGTSYFKLKAPSFIQLEFGLSPAAKRLVEDVYSNGLGEFYARNALNLFDELKISCGHIEPSTSSQATTLTAKKSSLLLIGGGKDSLVSAQIMDALSQQYVPFAVNAKGPILGSFEKLNHENLSASRTLDKKMIALSKLQENYNGHVPSTAMNSTIACLVANLHGFDQVILSNERSASEGNRLFAGRMVNHQHSKGLPFEKLFAAALSETGSSQTYFSILRPFSEAKIAQIFANETKFDDIFASCNRNFRQTGNDDDLWCCDCPKCRFVFLILAPHMPRARLLAIFGKDLFADQKSYEDFALLVGLLGHKPWECVGEIMEAAASVHQLMKSSEWQDEPLIQKLHTQLLKTHGQETLELSWNAAMNEFPDHIIPSDLFERVTQYVNR